MLQIKEVSKTYKTGDLVQVALDKASLNLRDSEFVAILGPSGSGKTTLLNIIGGLDKYDSGDLIIDNISTRKYRDRDWDSYRNHSVGFVFQSYNLIPHQNILSNVELALTIGGIHKSERKQRALEALDKVGLKDQAHKRPNQLSGGQMQRVAIARALVNNPKILLADEPTGALDTKTSIQVMELLKEIARDRLVVMVTHNPELADKYANRIVNLRDGKITGDSNPFIVEGTPEATHKNLGRASMSLFTAFSLSFNNLLTKIGRTLLTSFAGSIGIIGIALILSLSTGFQNYIDKIQEDTLSSYPLSINSDTADTTSLILSMVSYDSAETDGTDKVREKKYLTSVFSSIGTNDLRSFKKYLENNRKLVDEYTALVRYSYGITPLIYTKDISGKIVKVNPSSMMSSFYSSSVTSLMSSYSSDRGIFSEMIDKPDMIKEGYDLLAGRWPEKYDELLLVLSEPNTASDLLLYNLGLKEYSELNSMMSKIMAKEPVENNSEPLTVSYDELLKVNFRLFNASDIYKYDSEYKVYEDMSDDQDYLQKVYDASTVLRITGIVCSNGNSSSLALSNGVVYTKDLTIHVINEAAKSEIVRKQLTDKETDVFSNQRFDEENEKAREINFEDMITVDQDMIRDAFKINVDFSNLINTDNIADIAMNYGKSVASDIDNTAVSMVNGLEEMEKQLSLAMVQGFLQAKPDYDTSSGFYCPGGYADETHPEQGCLIPSGKDSEYMNMGGINIYIARPYNDLLGYDFAASMMNPLSVDNFPTMFFSTPQVTSMLQSMGSSFTSAGMSQSDFENLIKNASTEIFKQVFSTIYSECGVNLPSVSKVSTATFEEKYSLSDDASKKDFPEDASSVLNGNADIKNANYLAGINLAKQYNYALAAKGIGEALSEALSPMTKALSGEIMTVDTSKFASAFQFNKDQDELAKLMTAVMSGSREKNYKSNLASLGYQDLDEPVSISFYFKSFDNKEKFMDFLKAYNQKATEEQRIRYTDITGILMSSVKKIVDSVTYVLIAFVSISLVVSSIMIGIITYISVLERTKEIGILRAIGASKRNISSIFNAETFIVGLISGILGITITMLLNIPINNLIHSLTDNYNINAVLPVNAAIVLVILSVILTYIGGLIPSSAASRKDPVIALRTE